MKKYKFSLIMATCGRKEEVGNFLRSIEKSGYDSGRVQIIIVDQNTDINLEEELAPYKGKLEITHVKSHIKGLSRNRNIGLKKAEGEIIAFPDDDCEYLPETLMKIEQKFMDKSVDVVMGKIVERDGSDSLRKWPEKPVRLTKMNFFTKCSSVTMFIRAEGKVLSFNEQLGAGTFFGSCEDSDMLYKRLGNNESVLYFPDVEIYHPHYDSGSNMDIGKVKSYGLGFGAFVRSNLDFYLILLSIQVMGYHMVKTVIGILTFNSDKIKKGWGAFTSRLQGMITCKCE